MNASQSAQIAAAAMGAVGHDKSIRTSPIDTAVAGLQVKQDHIAERLADLETRRASVLIQLPKEPGGEAGTVTECGKSYLHECLLGAGRRADRHIDVLDSILDRLTV